ncbi:hypothetical protein ElyMa_006983900 [Elysia marginata]|uniref:Uncharacterized protein n=1 Tax=Elysia marginata TaxID=1093978 RepID=A0AAV4JPK5_9GAST|nr:hypothetical protein ElyMa_006983900 [Elysia marginata]
MNSPHSSTVRVCVLECMASHRHTSKHNTVLAMGHGVGRGKRREIYSEPIEIQYSHPGPEQKGAQPCRTQAATRKPRMLDLV